MRNTTRFLVVAAVLSALVGFAVPGEATNGYLIHGVGTQAKGLAGAGSALPQDTLAAGSNPAGMAFVGKRYDAGMALFNPNRQYTVAGAPSGFPGTFGLVPGTVESDSDLFFVPNFGANWQLNPTNTLGISLYGQGGMNTDYQTGTFFGTSPTGVDLSQLFIVPTWARTFAGGKHAFGVAPIFAVQFFEAQGLQAFSLFSQDPANLTNKGHDQSTGFGARLGYLGQWTPAFSFGIAFQSEIGMSEFDDYRGLFADNGDFDIPGNLVIGFAYQFGANAAFVFDYQEIYYSDVDAVHSPLFPNLFQAPLGAPGAAGFGWQDMEVIKLGFQWGGGPWTWRVGYSTADQPIPSSEVLFNILAPGVMEEHITLGFTRELGPARAINLSLMHAPSTSVIGPNPLEAPGFQTIELEMDQWDLEVGFSWGF